MIEFPVVFPTDAIQTLYTAWKNKDFTTPGLAKAIWNIGGYVLSMGGMTLARRAATAPPSDEQIEEAFQNLLKGAIDNNAIVIVHSVAEDTRDQVA